MDRRQETFEFVEGQTCQDGRVKPVTGDNPALEAGSP